MPEENRKELEMLVEFIREKIPYLEMVILYGSYARGNYVSYDRRIEFGISTFYRSDYDIVVLVSRMDNPAVLTEWLNGIRRRFKSETGAHTPVSFIKEHINKFIIYLNEGRYFYTTIKEQGILLYDSGNYKLPRRRPLRYNKIKKQAEEYFEDWYHRGDRFLKNAAEYDYEDGEYKMASFHLHQACESFFCAISLTYTLNKPKEHDLRSLIDYNKKFSAELLTVFPSETSEEERLFELLRAAYIQARYNKDFAVSKEDIEVLISWVRNFREVTGTICRDQFKEFDRLVALQQAKYHSAKPNASAEEDVNSVTAD